jgi:medium-chain acyl-[acyl-carrier-protein] hydrolase
LSKNNWFLTPQARPKAKMRIICFPYAGGNTSTFSHWANQLPDDIELVAAQYPGRTSRIFETMHNQMDDLVADLITTIPQYLDKPYILLGHSLGSRVAFELMHQINKLNMPKPEHFIASGSRGPQKSVIKKAIYNLTKDEFKAELAKLNGTPEAVLNNDDLMALYLPMLRADFQIADNYSFQKSVKFTCSFSVLAGSQDEITDEELNSWNDFFITKGEIITIEGDHFFIDKNSSATISAVNIIIESLLFTEQVAY